MGKTFANLSLELEGNEILGEVDFLDILKEKEKNMAKLEEFIKIIKDKIN